MSEASQPSRAIKSVPISANSVLMGFPFFRRARSARLRDRSRRRSSTSRPDRNRSSGQGAGSRSALGSRSGLGCGSGCFGSFSSFCFFSSSLTHRGALPPLSTALRRGERQGADPLRFATRHRVLTREQFRSQKALDWGLKHCARSCAPSSRAAPKFKKTDRSDRLHRVGQVGAHALAYFLHGVRISLRPTLPTFQHEYPADMSHLLERAGSDRSFLRRRPKFYNFQVTCGILQFSSDMRNFTVFK